MKVARISNKALPLTKDEYLLPFRKQLLQRAERAENTINRLTNNGKITLNEFASAHEYFGLHKKKDCWIFREWAPNATKIYFSGDFCNWSLESCYELRRLPYGKWEITLPLDLLKHGTHYALRIFWDVGDDWRIPAYCRYVVQDKDTKLFCASVYSPEKRYEFLYEIPEKSEYPLIYESHIGMAQEEEKVGSFNEYREKILPKIAKLNYNTIQLMAIMEHPYYGSFGYHVSNFFSISSRFGTPDEFKALVDQAHKLNIRVIIDLVHSHSVKNQLDGLANFDGKQNTYFHEGERGEHSAWDSLCFNYNKNEVLHFLLSNCRYYLDEFKIDGFRFDGITSMMYLHHGLGKVFVNYSDYFENTDEDAICYLNLANRLIHDIRPDAITIAEDVSGMPGLASSDFSNGAVGFDYRMSMGVTDMWFKLFDLPDESWDMFYIYHELTNRRKDERSISYVECHDQAIVGGQSVLFRLLGAAIYNSMHKNSQNLLVDRAMAIHKISRLLTAATAGHGYLNFMGNEFGHPEWIDFPRADNNWSYSHARRQWSLSEDDNLRFIELRKFDEALIKLLRSITGFYSCNCQTIRIDNEKKIIIFERQGYYFCVNLNPVNSYNNYTFPVLSGEFVEVLDSDALEFGGFGMRENSTVHYSKSTPSGDELSLYLPSRTILVLHNKSQIT